MTLRQALKELNIEWQKFAAHFKPYLEEISAEIDYWVAYWRMPKTIDEATDKIIELVLSSNAPEYLREYGCEDFGAVVHDTLGRWIRNNWGLWRMRGPIFRELANKSCLSHADDLSGLLIGLAWMKYHKDKIELYNPDFFIMGESKKYHKHWAKEN